MKGHRRDAAAEVLSDAGFEVSTATVEGSTALRQAASLVDFGAKPLIVLTAGQGHDAQWMSGSGQAGHSVDEP